MVRAEFRAAVLTHLIGITTLMGRIQAGVGLVPSALSFNSAPLWLVKLPPGAKEMFKS